MRKEKVITKLLQRFIRLVGEEVERNPEFAGRLGDLLEEIPQTKKVRKKKTQQAKKVQALNIYDERNKRSEDDFKLWLHALDLNTLYAIIKRNEFDPSRRTFRWKDPEKLSTFIIDKLNSRMNRGASFMKHGANSED